MVIEGRRDGFPFGRDGIVDFGVEQELPQVGTGGFTPSAVDNVLLGAEDGNGMFLVKDFSDIVAEGADAHEVVGTVSTGLGTWGGERLTDTSGE